MAKLPHFMPIVAERMAAGAPYPQSYDERELTEPVDLCDARGGLNPAAVGWSRQPLVRANLSGHRLRKKRWNFWNWISPRFVFSVTLADIDFAAFCQMTFTDFQTGQHLGAMAPAWPGSLGLPEHVERTVEFHRGGLEYSNVVEGNESRIHFAGTPKGGDQVVADFVVHRPAGHESLNIVAPWSRERFQLNSKHNTLPCEGVITVGSRRYEMSPADCHAVQDFGRGMWPYRSFWNWGVGTGVQDGHLVGINVGGKWTTGTGVNENGLLIDGRLHKIHEDLVWSWEPRDWKQPWRVRTVHTDTLDLTLSPVAAHQPRTNIGIIRSGGTCAFGKWNGAVRYDGSLLQIRDLIGWAEEFEHRW